MINGSTATLNVAGTLSFQTANSGVLATNTAGLVITNTSAAAIFGGGLNAYINGPVTWNLPSNLATGSTYNFPVGGTTGYLPFALVNPTTGAGPAASATVEAFNIDPTGTHDGTLTSISNTEYWSLITTGDFNNSTVSLGKPGLSANAIAATSSAPSGMYTSLGGIVNGIFIINSNDIGSDRYFTLGVATSAINIDAALDPTSVSYCLWRSLYEHDL